MLIARLHLDFASDKMVGSNPFSFNTASGSYYTTFNFDKADVPENGSINLETGILASNVRNS